MAKKETKQKQLRLEKLNKKRKKKIAESKTKKETKRLKPEMPDRLKTSEKPDEKVEKEETAIESKEMNEEAEAKEKAEAEKKIKEEDSYFAKWIAPEHVKTQEDVIIYYASAILSVFAIIWFYFQGSFIVIVTFLMLLIVIMLHIYQQPRDIELKIDLDGIAFGDVFYEYKNIESFEVAEGEYFDVLKFKLRNSILPVKEIQIIDQNPRYIRAVLENFLPEEKQQAALIGFKKKSEFDEYFSEEDFDDYLKEKEKLEKLERREKEK